MRKNDLNNFHKPIERKADMLYNIMVIFFRSYIMDVSAVFFVENLLLGTGLAMDAFSVSLVNGMSEPCMKRKKAFTIALIFALFQAAMPLIGWFCVHNIVDKFKMFRPVIPWIAFVLLLYIGIEMIKNAVKHTDSTQQCIPRIRLSALLIQGIATSIDALSAGFTLATYNTIDVFCAVAIIASVTFLICFGGVYVGKKFGTYLSNKSLVFGGSILIFIGVEILIKGVI